MQITIKPRLHPTPRGGPVRGTTSRLVLFLIVGFIRVFVFLAVVLFLVAVFLVLTSQLPA